jgi:hypothetical protein
MKLLFVYNAKAGLVAGMMDSIHKAVSPDTYECSLCAITHGAFTMNKDWRAYLKTLPLPVTFHHRPDFREAYPDAKVDLPAVLLDRDGALEVVLTAADLKAAPDVNGLSAALDAALLKTGVKRP